MLACKLSLVFVALVIVVQSRGPLVRKTPSPQPFFPQYSLVTDFYNGDVRGLTERLLAADLSLVMYYAPWDRSSQTLRWEVERAAQYHHEQVYFAAINCWQPGSECKSRYKIRKYPAIVLHIRTSSGMETKALAYGGIPEAAHLIRFLSRCLRPLTHITSHADLTRLQIDHNGVVIGFYDFTSALVPRGFTSYYLAAMRWLQHEPGSAVAWGVVTNPHVAHIFNINTSQSIHLALWNTTLVFTNAVTSDSESISNWVARRLHETVSWVHLSGDKSQVISSATQEGPTLLLFSPDNPYLNTNDPFTLLRELSLEYFNCNQSNKVSTMARYLGASRFRGRSLHRKAEKACHSFLAQHIHMLQFSEQHTSDVQTCWNGLDTGIECTPRQDGETNNKECTTNSDNNNNNNIQVKTNLLDQVKSLMMMMSDSCREIVMQYTSWKDPSLCCHQTNTTTSTSKPTIPHMPIPKTNTKDKSMKAGQTDDHIEMLEDLAGEEECKRMFQGSLLGSPPVIKDQKSSLDITGLGCKTNKTLLFLAVDSRRHQEMANRLGVNFSSHDPPNTAAVIIDVAREAHFIMDATLSKHTLASFILNYTNGILDRTLVSETKQKTHCDTYNQMCIQKLTADNYFKVTQQSGKTVVVLHYNSNCVSCTSVGHVFLSVAHTMRHLPDVEFARMNTVGNVLPWNLHFNTLPTIIVHPPFRKSESRVFETTQPITQANLISFIMADLEPRHRLMLALHTCGEQCREKVLHEAGRTITTLQHNITVSTSRLQRVLDKLTKAAIASHPVSDSSPHEHSYYERLRRTKTNLVKDIKTQKKKLEHLNHMQSLLSKPLDSETLDSWRIETFNYLNEKLSSSSSSSSKKEFSNLDVTHDEL